MDTMKITYNDDTRRFRFPATASLDNVQHVVAATFGVKDYALKYQDVDGDMVNIVSDEDFRLAKEEMDVIRLHVTPNRAAPRAAGGMSLESTLQAAKKQVKGHPVEKAIDAALVSTAQAPVPASEESTGDVGVGIVTPVQNGVGNGNEVVTTSVAPVTSLVMFNQSAIIINVVAANSFE
mmetsp:Transcript_23346/g.65572  ORF Transcript_23346/g.65572 Transcript_23346/m.65572 type:complete len:179 (+) Transcript_23346:193-729(+)